MRTAEIRSLFPQPIPTQPQASIHFEAIWKLWPNKSKKLAAKAKYEAILAGCDTRTLDRDSGLYMDLKLQATEERIVEGIKLYLASQVDKNTYRLKDDGRYIPHLSTFLNGGRYEDYL